LLLIVALFRPCAVNTGLGVVVALAGGGCGCDTVLDVQFLVCLWRVPPTVTANPCMLCQPMGYMQTYL
jgi:hypothetical protein